MTEKRFIIANYPSDIEDTLTGKKYAMSSYYTHIEIICDLLNELNDKNEQLKQAYNDAKKDVEKKEQILKDIMNDNLLIQDIKKELQEND